MERRGRALRAGLALDMEGLVKLPGNGWGQAGNSSKPAPSPGSPRAANRALQRARGASAGLDWVTRATPCSILSSMLTQRILGPDDGALLESFLLPRIASSMILLANSRAAGLVDGGAYLHGTYAAAFD